MTKALGITGSTLQAVGLVITALPSLRELHPLRWLLRGWRSLLAKTRKALRIKGKDVHVQGRAAFAAAVGLAGTVRIIPGPLDATLPVEDQVKQLDETVRRIYEWLSHDIDDLRKKDRELQSAIDSVGQGAAAGVAHVEEGLRRSSATTLRVNAWGVPVIVVGMVLSTVAFGLG